MVQGSQREGREGGAENMLEDIIAENFPTLRKEAVTQVQKVQRPVQDEPKEEHTKTHCNSHDKNERKNMKSSSGKTTNNIQGNSHKAIS